MTEYLNEIKKLMVGMIVDGASMDEIERVSKHSATVIMSEKENGIEELFSKYKPQHVYTVEESDEPKETEVEGTKPVGFNNRYSALEAAYSDMAEAFARYRQRVTDKIGEETEVEGTKLEKAKQIIKKYFSEASCGLFFTRNWVGDEMAQIYKDNELAVDICYRYEYFEVFGLGPEEQEELEKYYNELKEEDE